MQATTVTRHVNPAKLIVVRQYSQQVVKGIEFIIANFEPYRLRCFRSQASKLRLSKGQGVNTTESSNTTKDPSPLYLGISKLEMLMLTRNVSKDAAAVCEVVRATA